MKSGEKPPSPGELAPHDPVPPSEGPICDLCGGTMYYAHCKIICPDCGYMRDCSDPAG